MSFIIKSLHARQILDSRGNPTVETEITLSDGSFGRASVPSGASTGKKEARELRDNNPHIYSGKGVLNAVKNINETIADNIINVNWLQQSELDQILCNLDGTAEKANLGANAILSVSLAFARARAKSLKQPLYASLENLQPQNLPMPMMNILNGGAHADNNVDIQEFMIMPIGAESFAHALQMGAEIFHALKALLKRNGLNTAVGDEGGFAPSLDSNRQALDLLTQAIQLANYTPGQQVVFALDVAASELFNDGIYLLESEQKHLNSDQFIRYYEQLCSSYPIVSIEDGLDESDWDGWKNLTSALGNKIQLVGDDLFVTHTKLLQQGIDNNIANAILIKPNQVGTLTETLAAINLGHKHQYQTVMSHRSGETEDAFIADLAVASNCMQIKTGSLCRSDRMAKYNQLLRIEEQTKLPLASPKFHIKNNSAPYHPEH